MNLLLLLGLGIAFAGAAFWVLLRKLANRSGAELPDPAWLSRFSMESYAPMERLLDRTDFAFLESQPGCTAKIMKKMLRQRRKLFHEYLRLLVRDFGRVVAVGKLLMVHSSEDKAEFGRALFRIQAAFFVNVLVIRCKLAVYPWGWTGVDVARLVHSIESLGAQVQGMALRHNTAAA
jgi:hypothetical protein